MITDKLESNDEKEGFEEVLSRLSYVNQKKSGIDGGDSLDEDLYQSVILRHIIVYERISAKGTYRVLELQPQDMTANARENYKKNNNKTFKPLKYDLRVPAGENGTVSL